MMMRRLLLSPLFLLFFVNPIFAQQSLYEVVGAVPVSGRTDEIKKLIGVLSRTEGATAIIVGSPGVGKTAVVSGLVEALFAEPNAHLPKPTILRANPLLFMDADTALQALQKLFSLRAEEGHTLILFLDDFHLWDPKAREGVRYFAADHNTKLIASGPPQLLQQLSPDLLEVLHLVPVQELSPEHVREALQVLGRGLEAGVTTTKITDAAINKIIEYRSFVQGVVSPAFEKNFLQDAFIEWTGEPREDLQGKQFEKFLDPYFERRFGVAPGELVRRRSREMRRHRAVGYERNLSVEVVNIPEALRVIGDALRHYHSGTQADTQTPLVIGLFGLPGSGVSKTVSSTARYLYDGADRYHVVDLATFQSANDVDRWFEQGETRMIDLIGEGIVVEFQNPEGASAEGLARLGDILATGDFRATSLTQSTFFVGSHMADDLIKAEITEVYGPYEEEQVLSNALEELAIRRIPQLMDRSFAPSFRGAIDAVAVLRPHNVSSYQEVTRILLREKARALSAKLKETREMTVEIEFASSTTRFIALEGLQLNRQSHGIVEIIERVVQPAIEEAFSSDQLAQSKSVLVHCEAGYVFRFIDRDSGRGAIVEVPDVDLLSEASVGFSAIQKSLKGASQGLVDEEMTLDARIDAVDRGMLAGLFLEELRKWEGTSTKTGHDVELSWFEAVSRMRLDNETEAALCAWMATDRNEVGSRILEVIRQAEQLQLSELMSILEREVFRRIRSR